MKKKELIFMAMALMLLTACGKSEGEQQVTANYTVNIDGERTYISDDDEQVVAAKETAMGYLTNYANKDYTKQGNMEILPYLADKLRTTYEQKNTVGVNQESIRNYELIEKMESYEISYVQMYTLYGQPAADIFLSYTVQIETATEAYLSSLGMSAGDRYKRTLTLKLEDTEEGWKINKASLGAREVIK
ncbi:MAG: hypothetical protein E7256_10125 [Lachnospiraceae bacterium]|nr:hypothetical protein [Lachnospiraceae bacterium]